MPILLGLALGILLGQAIKVSHRLNESQQRFNQVSVDAFQLSVLTHEIMAHPVETRARRQWQNKYEQIDHLLGGLELHDYCCKQALHRCRLNQQQLSHCYRQLIDLIQRTHPSIISKTLSDIDQKRIAYLVGQMSSQVHNMVAEMLIMQKHNQYELRKRESFLKNSAVVILGVLSATTIIFVWIFSRRIVVALTRLRQGMDCVAAGDLDHQIGMEPSDEMGKLACAFDVTIDVLRQTMASRDELNQEVSERRAVERQLCFTKFCVDHSSELSYWMDDEANIIYVNDAACHALGYTEAELLTMKIYDVDKQFNEDHWSLHRQMIQREQCFTIESIHRCKDGTPLPVDMTVNVLDYEGQVFTCIFARDITERLESAHEIEQMARFPQENPYPVLRVSQEGEVLYANGASLRLLQEHHSGVKQPAPQELRILAEKVLKQGRQDGIEIKYEGRLYYLRATPVQEVGYVNMYGVDITDRKEAERKLYQTLKELKRSNEELEQFATLASHDLREPLRMVSSYVELLAKRYHQHLDEDADLFIKFALDGAHRMERMIGDLLTYSRVERKGHSFTEVSARQIVATAFKNLEVAAQGRQVEIDQKSLPEEMRGDHIQLIQLFQNLISNALKFSDQQAGIVHIWAESRLDCWVFGVQDNGIGIAPEYQQRIFELFQRLHTHEEYEGTGVGLALCKRIVERHGGRIWLESEEGMGTCFYFSIPFHPIAIEPTGINPSEFATNIISAAV